MMKYIGKGWIYGIPARDLTDAEVNKYGEEFLKATGLYEVAQSKRLRSRKVTEDEPRNKELTNDNSRN